MHRLLRHLPIWPPIACLLIALLVLFASVLPAAAATKVRIEWIRSGNVIGVTTISSSGTSAQSGAAPSFGGLAGQARITVVSGAAVVNITPATSPVATETTGLRLAVGGDAITISGVQAGLKLAAIEAADAPISGSVNVDTTAMETKLDTVIVNTDRTADVAEDPAAGLVKLSQTTTDNDVDAAVTCSGVPCPTGAQLPATLGNKARASSVGVALSTEDVVVQAAIKAAVEAVQAAMATAIPPGTNYIGDTGRRPYPTGATAITGASGNVANANAVATLTGAVSKTTYITGFNCSGAGATAAAVKTITVTGTITGTLSYTFTFPAGATAAATPIDVQFPTPVPSSTTNTNIVVTLPAAGTGNTNATCVASGFTL